MLLGVQKCTLYNEICSKELKASLTFLVPSSAEKGSVDGFILQVKYICFIIRTFVWLSLYLLIFWFHLLYANG